MKTPLFALVAAFMSANACMPAEDWADPEWIGHRIAVGDDRAFNEFTRLSLEDQRSLVPVLIETFNTGLKQERCLQALVMAADPSARDTFITSLGRSDDNLAALGARGLAAIGAMDTSTQVAQRLAEVVVPDAFSPFMDAMSDLATPESADVIAGVLMRQAQRIGGIATVRRGCVLLGGIQTSSEAVMDALVYSLTNFVPLPFEDAINECELALIAHADAAVPYLATLFRGENERVNAQLRNFDYPLVTGHVRAALVLAHIRSDAAIQVFHDWYNQPHPVPIDELSQMDVMEQQEWYNTHGQLFDVTTMGLSYRGSDADRQMLLRLEHTAVPPEPETALDNFREWLGLSDGAEVGLRQSVYEALMMVGAAPEDRELMWQVALSGTTGRGGANSAGLLRMNILHYIGRTAVAGETTRFDTTLAAQVQAFQGDFAPLRAYFVLADQCGEAPACYAAAITDISPVRNDPSVQTLLSAPTDPQIRDMTSLGVESCTKAGAIWHLVLRYASSPEAGPALLSALEGADMEVRMQIAEALLVMDPLPADTAQRIDALLEAEENVRGIALMREFRHALRLVRALRP